MKTTVNTYSNDLGSIVHYSVRTWTTHVYAVERFVLESRLTTEQKESLTKAGVYLLVNNTDVYVGQTQNILERWKQHLASEDKDWFDCAYAITDVNHFSATDLNALEYLFHSKAIAAHRFNVTNSKPTDNQRNDYETDKDFYDNVFENVNTLLNSIYRGHRVFNAIDDIEVSKESAETSEPENELMGKIFKFSQAECYGELKRVKEGWLLLKGAQARQRDFQNKIKDVHLVQSISYCVKYLDGKLDSSLKTTEDILFTSPSAPIMAILQTSNNGWVSWKDDEGNLLEIYRDKI